MSGIVERAIASISPEWSLRRELARVKLDALSRYRQLVPSRDRRLLPAITDTESRQLEWHDRLRVIAAVRRLGRENPLFSGILNTFCVNVVGPGIRPLPASGDRKFDEEAALLFDDWSESPDLRGMMNFAEFQRILLRTVLTDSDCGVLLTSGGQIQGIEGDCIQTPARFASREGFSICQGVQFDPSTGAPERYWVLRRRNGKDCQFDQTSARGIDRRYFIHVGDVDRFSSYRGLTPAFAALDWLRDLDEICDFTKFAFKIQSIFAIALTGGDDESSKPGLAGYMRGDDAGEKRQMPQLDLKKGSIIDLSAYNAKDLKTIAPTTPGPQFAAFSEFIANMIGLSFGLPLDLVTCRLHEGNYSSQRMVFRVSMKTFLQKWRMLTVACRRIYAWKVGGWIREGRLRPGRDCRYPLYARWSLPIPESADPEKEVYASLWAEAAGYSDKDSECLARGRDRREVAERQAEVIREMESMKLPFVVTPTPGVSTLGEINAKISNLRRER